MLIAEINRAHDVSQSPGISCVSSDTLFLSLAPIPQEKFMACSLVKTVSG